MRAAIEEMALNVVFITVWPDIEVKCILDPSTGEWVVHCDNDRALPGQLVHVSAEAITIHSAIQTLADKLRRDVRS